jgi:hypothetical protein
MSKTHYRKVFKSDHLGQADIEEYQEAGSDLIFTIAQVKQEYGVRVGGSKGDHNIAYFKDKGVKPWALNATNSKILRGFCGGSPFIEDWTMPVTIRIYADPNVKMKGERTGGLKINPQQPILKKPTITPENDAMWNNAKAAYKRDGNFDAVFKRADISKENQDKIAQECSADV